jgi:hypothetical protein
MEDIHVQKWPVVLLLIIFLLAACSNREDVRQEVNDKETTIEEVSEKETDVESDENFEETDQIQWTNEAIEQLGHWNSFHSVFQLAERYVSDEEERVQTTTQTVVQSPFQLHSISEMSSPSYFELYGNLTDGVYALDMMGTEDWYRIVDEDYLLIDQMPDKIQLLQKIITYSSSIVTTEDFGGYLTVHAVIENEGNQQYLDEISHLVDKITSFANVEENDTSPPLNQYYDLGLAVTFKNGQLIHYSINVWHANQFVGEGEMTISEDFEQVNEITAIDIPDIVFKNAGE